MPEPTSYALERGDETLDVPAIALPAKVGQGWEGTDAASKKAVAAVQAELDAAHGKAAKTTETEK